MNIPEKCANCLLVPSHVRITQDLSRLYPTIFSTLDKSTCITTENIDIGESLSLSHTCTCTHSHSKFHLQKEHLPQILSLVPRPNPHAGKRVWCTSSDFLGFQDAK